MQSAYLRVIKPQTLLNVMILGCQALHAGHDDSFCAPVLAQSDHKQMKAVIATKSCPPCPAVLASEVRRLATHCEAMDCRACMQPEAVLMHAQE